MKDVHMRDIFRNPIFYYLLIPVLVGVWPLLIWAVYLPAAQRERENDYSLLLEGQTNIMEILKIDPQRTNPADPNRVAGEFDYGKAIDSATNRCGIAASRWSYNAGPVNPTGGKKRQDARVWLKDVTIVQAAKFLSTMQLTWIFLDCDRMKLTKKKGMPDQWDIDFDLLYYY